MQSRLELQRAYRRLIAGAACFVVVHVLGLITMLLLLLPGLDPALPIEQRAAYVQHAPWAWRLGWLPWQLSALSDAWVAWALLAWTRALGANAHRARAWSWGGIALFLLAAVPEQYAEAHLVTDFVAPRALDVWRADLDSYMWLTGTWANSAYTLMTACWLLAVRAAARAYSGCAAAPVWNRVLALVVLAAFAAAGLANHRAFAVAPALPEDPAAFALASLLNGVAFPGLLLLALVASARLGAIQLQAIGRDAFRPVAPRWPVADARIGRWLAQIAGSAGLRDLVRALLTPLPFPTLRSDIRDVLYLSWLVSADAVDAVLPAGMRAQREGSHALISALIYRHGHFGPAWLGPLRGLMASPIQCNVRAYLAGPGGRVVFLANSLDAPLYFLGTRLLSDGLPAHYAASARALRNGARLEFAVEAGDGSALALRCTVEEENERGLPPEFARAFDDYLGALAAIVPQNAAVRALATTGQVCTSDIVVDAPLETVRPARVVGELVIGEPLASLVASAPVLAFVVPAVRFVVRGETWVNGT